MSTVKAYAAAKASGLLQPFEHEPGPLGTEHVDIDVRYCGICHSDLSMLDNEWGFSRYPLVAGHEVIGTVAAVGGGVRNVRPGQTVGLGWYSQSCMMCHECLLGDHNLCATAEATIVGRPGGFANQVRAHWAWVFPLPDGLDPATSGPLFCGGITVFNPIVRNGIIATDRVGDAAPQREDVLPRATCVPHAGGARQPLRDVRQEHCRDDGQADRAAFEKRDADDDRLWDAVQQCANGDRDAAALVRPRLLIARALAVSRAEAGEQPVGAGEDDGSRNESQRRREEPTTAVGLVHQLEGERRDQNSAAERHDARDETLRQPDEVADQRADEQRRAGDQSP
jgi:hypothetical protein